MNLVLRVTVLASAVLLMLPGAWSNSVTVVEFAQLPAGLATWRRHTHALYAVCGPVSKLLYASPAYLAGVRLDYPDLYDAEVEARHEWSVGRLFQQQNCARYQDIYRAARLLPIVITVLGGVLICEWATRLYGARPGIVALCLWCWMPLVLGHGALVTSDIMAAVALLVVARTFWAFLLRPRWSTALGAGVALGLAEATKFTLLVVTPCWGVLLAGRIIQLRGSDNRMPVLSDKQGNRRRKETAEKPPMQGGTTQTLHAGNERANRQFGLSALSYSCPSTRLLAFGLILLVVSLLTIDACYGFRDVGVCLANWKTGHSSLLRDLNQLSESPITAWLLDVPLPIPLELLRGIDVQLADTERLQSTYLLGQSRPGGWWYWYAAAALFKIPIPVLIFFVVSLLRPVATLQGRWKAHVGASEPASVLGPSKDLIFWASLCLLMPAAEIALTITATTGTGSNAAFRYLLPTLALLCVWTTRVTAARSKAAQLSTIVLLSWLFVNATGALPDHLGWQNELAWVSEYSTGRPALIGDSLDWGQDLARLGKWIKHCAAKESIVVCVYDFGYGDPYGLKPPVAWPTSISGQNPTYLAVSANILFGHEPSTAAQIAGSYSSLTKMQRAELLRQAPYARIGRTVRIYQFRDMPPDFLHAKE